MKIRVLGSGSSGNCTAVRATDGTLVLVDFGLSARETSKRAKACGFDPAETAGICFTHDHIDHCTGLRTFHAHHPDIPLFANGDTCDAIARRLDVDDGWCPFETAIPFALGGFRITPFSISHDAADPVGYLLEDVSAPVKRTAAGKAAPPPALFVGTDTGLVTTGMRDAFTRCDIAILESNHDPILLEESDRAPALKQRIRGRSGHLANEDAAQLVRETNPPRLRTLLLAHLSRECNTPSLARAAMRDALAALKRTDVRLEILAPDVPSDLFESPDQSAFGGTGRL